MSTAQAIVTEPTNPYIIKVKEPKFDNRIKLVILQQASFTVLQERGRLVFVLPEGKMNLVTKDCLIGFETSHNNISPSVILVRIDATDYFDVSKKEIKYTVSKMSCDIQLKQRPSYRIVNPNTHKSARFSVAICSNGSNRIVKIVNGPVFKDGQVIPTVPARVAVMNIVLQKTINRHSSVPKGISPRIGFKR